MARLLKDLDEVAKLRGSTVNDLARIYLEAGLHRDLHKSFAQRFMAITDRVLHEQTSLQDKDRNNLIATIEQALELESYEK